jgi:hypothetical protein
MGKDDVRILVCRAGVVVAVRYRNVTCVGVAGNLAQRGVDALIQKIERRLTLEMHAGGGHERYDAVVQGFTESGPAEVVGGESSGGVHLIDDRAPLFELGFQVLAAHRAPVE